MTSFIHRITHMSRELKIFAASSLFLGLAFSIMDSTLNNFLNERFTLSGFERSFLELPRELPGFLVVFVSALLWFLSSRRLGTAALLTAAAGALLVGFASSSYGMMVIWLFIYSLGQLAFCCQPNFTGCTRISPGLLQGHLQTPKPRKTPVNHYQRRFPGMQQKCLDLSNRICKKDWSPCPIPHRIAETTDPIVHIFQ